MTWGNPIDAEIERWKPAIISGLQQVARAWSVQGAQISGAPNGFQLSGTASHPVGSTQMYPITVIVQMRYGSTTQSRFCFKVLSKGMGYGEYPDNTQGLREAFEYILQGGSYFFLA